jgi:hypothetical protein
MTVRLPAIALRQVADREALRRRRRQDSWPYPDNRLLKCPWLQQARRHALVAKERDDTYVADDHDANDDVIRCPEMSSYSVLHKHRVYSWRSARKTNAQLR